MLAVMLLTGGVAYAGTVWLIKRPARKTRSFLVPPAQAAETNSKRSLIASAQEQLHIMLGATHLQHLREVGSANGPDQVQGLHNATLKMTVTSVSLGFATIGPLVYPPLSLLCIPGLLYVCLDFFKSAYVSVVEEKRANIDLLVLCVAFFCLTKGYYFAFSFQTWFGMYSRQLMARIRDNSQHKVIDVFRQRPHHVWLLVEGAEIEVPFEKVHEDDIVVVDAGGVIPVDGQIINGLASVDQHILTGESQPVDKESGDTVYALTVVLSGKLHIRVTKAGQETTAAQIGDILNRTVNFKTHRQLRVEAAGDQAVIPMLLASGLSIPFIGPASAFALLNSHPRYKANITTYLSIFRFFEEASQHGILIKDGIVLERLNEIDTVVFDKTGTLTQAQPHIDQIHPWSGYTKDEVLTLAASAEAKQVHPIAQAIQEAAEAQGLPLLEIEEAEYALGFGLKVIIAGKRVQVGSRRFIEQEGFVIPEAMQELQEFCHQQGHTFVIVTEDAELAGAIELHATVRPEAQAVLHGLHERGITSLAIISGDHQRPTQRLAEILGVDQYFAETLPENKSQLIQQLQQAGKTVCYVGDGINDAIALKQADVSVSLRGASTVATDTAQVVLMDGSLHQLCALFDLAKAFDDKMTTIFGLVLLPVLLSASGALLLHFGFLYSVLLPNLGLMLGVANAVWPQEYLPEETAVLGPDASQESIEQA